MSTLSVIDGAINGSQVRVYQGNSNLASSTANLDRVELCMGEAGTVKNFCVEVFANALPGPTLIEVLKNGAPIIPGHKSHSRKLLFRKSVTHPVFQQA